MRIQHNIMAMNAYRNYNTNTSALSKNLEKLSSGYKINRAGDDAAGLAISEKMRAQVTGLTMAKKNAKDGISMVQTAEGALTEVHDMLNRMVELSTQAANGTYDSNTDLKYLDQEYKQLQNEITRISTASNFNGKQIFTKDTVTLQIGEKALSAYTLTFSIGALTLASLGITGGAVSIATMAGATAAISAINNTGIKFVNEMRSKLGANQNRLEHTINNLGVMIENIQDAESTIRDTDVAEEMMAYTKNNILIQSAQAMLAQANQVPQGVLQLLQ
ncbi:flagellin N-terminal helical domain-containing protein [Candidatus Avoscillospira sp. LCP25S3_F1]|uniref:flagellin N-terminal helical domain-containing protein n=1 Tax=Candidatus Avoscillospira sp. LCP25S3_F1 TaxID=3438825 RepID=UPI003F91C565